MSVATFQPKLWAAALEVPFKASLVFGNPLIADTRFQPMLQAQGRSVSINTIGAAKVKPHDRTQDLEYDDVTTTEVELVMDQEDYYGFRVSDVDKVQAAGDFQSVSTEMHAQEMASTVDAYLAKQIAAGAKTKLGTKPVFDGADFFRPAEGQRTAFDILADVALELNKVSAPNLSRWAVVGPKFASALLRDRRVTQADKAGTNEGLRSGEVGYASTLGLTIFQSNNVVTTSTRETLSAGVPGSLVAATQLLEVEALRDPDRFGDLFRGLQVYGAQVIRPTGLVTVEADVLPGTLGSGAAAAGE